MTTLKSTLPENKLVWTGVYAFPGYEKITGLPPVPNDPGIALRGYEGRPGEYILRTMCNSDEPRNRLAGYASESKQGYRAILDPVQAGNGVRVEQWKRWSERLVRPPEWKAAKRAEWKRREAELLEKLDADLAATRLFHTEVADPRLRQRIVAAIVQRGTHTKVFLRTAISARHVDEEEILVRNVTPNGITIHGLPERMPI